MVDMEAWEKELEEETNRRSKAGEFLTWEALHEKYDVIFGSWPDYHKGDSYSVMDLIKQFGYKHAYHLGYFNTGPALSKRKGLTLHFHSGYFFIYSKEKLTPKIIHNIKVDLGIDLAEMYNIDWHL